MTPLSHDLHNDSLKEKVPMNVKTKNSELAIPAGIDRADYDAALADAPKQVSFTDPNWVDEVRAHLDTLDPEVASEIEADGARMWALRLHLYAMVGAVATAAARTEAEAAERVRIAATQCPVCEASDRDRIGTIALRALLPGHAYSAFNLDATPTLNSCLACWNVRSTQYVAQLAGETLDGGTTRAKLLAEVAS